MGRVGKWCQVHSTGASTSLVVRDLSFVQIHSWPFSIGADRIERRSLPAENRLRGFRGSGRPPSRTFNRSRYSILDTLSSRFS